MYFDFAYIGKKNKIKINFNTTLILENEKIINFLKKLEDNNFYFNIISQKYIKEISYSQIFKILEKLDKKFYKLDIFYKYEDSLFLINICGIDVISNKIDMENFEEPIFDLSIIDVINKVKGENFTISLYRKRDDKELEIIKEKDFYHFYIFSSHYENEKVKILKNKINFLKKILKDKKDALSLMTLQVIKKIEGGLNEF